jgi:hypothetical protein
MKLTIGAAEFHAFDIHAADVVAVQELRIAGKGLSLSMERGGPITIRELEATLIVTEASINKVLARNSVDGVRDLEVATLKGKLRISGKYDLLGPVAIPFTLTAIPEVVGGTRIRLNALDLEVIGLFSVPGSVKKSIETKINETLSDKFDASKLPVPFRLTNVSVEPGRVLAMATAAVDLRSLPSAEQPNPSIEEGGASAT